ncbi:MAG: hypothetical protein M3345_02380 [Actinomycetota bacterium]|nr:hypothetical protein [Actinomycetota bacterium]
MVVIARRSTAVLLGAALTFGAMAAWSPPASACPELECTVACVKAAIANPKDPVCPM